MVGDKEGLALCRLTETGHIPYIRHSENLHPIRDEPFLNIFLCAAILQTQTASVVVAFIVDLKDTMEEFQILRGRYDGRLVRFGAVECHWTIVGELAASFVDIFYGGSDAVVSYVVHDNLITSQHVSTSQAS